MKQSRPLLNTAGCLLALTSLMLSPSCSQEEIAMPADEGFAKFRISIPDAMGTRATFGDMDKADINTLHWTLFEVSTDNDGNETYMEVGSDVDNEAFKTGDKVSETVSMPLVVGKQYRIAFCAMNDGNNLVEYKDGTLVMRYENAQCNSADDDVFTGVSALIDMTNGTGYSGEVTLERPLAQINWGSTDFDEDAVAVHIDETSATVAYNSGLYGSLDIVRDMVGDPKSDIVFPAVDCSKLPTQDFPIEDKSGVKLVAMTYVLTAKGQSTIDCRLSFSTGFSTQVEVNSAPVQANYRTNIYGSLITNSGDVTVEMSNKFDGSANDRYLSPETRKVVDALNRKASEVVIPEGATIDLTGLGTFNLADGQTITVNGELVLDTNQLVLNEEAGKTLTVTFQGKGTIYGNKAKNLIYINKGTKAIIKDLNYVCIWNSTEKNGSGIIDKGELELHNVKIESNLYGICMRDGGTLKATDSTIRNFAENSHAIYSEKDGNIHLTGCTVISENMTAIMANQGTHVYIEGGYYCAEYNSHTIEFDNGSEGELKGCSVVSKSKSAVCVMADSKATIKSGRYIAKTNSGVLRVQKENPTLIVEGGEFMGGDRMISKYSGKFDRDKAKVYLDITDETIILKGGKYSGCTVGTVKQDTADERTEHHSWEEFLQPASGYHLENITGDPELKYQIVADNAQ